MFALYRAAFLILLMALTSCGGNSGSEGPPSSEKAITSFSFASTGSAGVINESAKTISVIVPYGTNVATLAATFTTTGASLKAGSTVQTSGATSNDFTGPLAYIVTADDGSTATYTVTVTVAANPAKEIVAFSFACQAATGTINEGTKTVSMLVPYWTNVTALTATFTTTGASVTVNSTVQVSGTSSNDFTSPVGYLVTAADSTTVTYSASVTKSPPKLPDTGQTSDYTTTPGEDSSYSINPPSYLDNGDGTIFDKVTGLMWQKCTVGKSGTACSTGAATAYNWYQASGAYDATFNPGGVNVCGDLTLAGYTDWRLPTDMELILIIDFGRSQPAIDITYFPDTWSWYWSSATYAGNTTFAWRVGFNDYEGVSTAGKSSGAGTFVRCVR